MRAGRVALVALLAVVACGDAADDGRAAPGDDPAPGGPAEGPTSEDGRPAAEPGAGPSADGGTSDAAEDAAAAALLPASKRFDLNQPSFDLFRRKTLHDARVMQGFAVDEVNGRLFVAQLQNGTSGDDLCISQLSLTGQLLGFVHLDGAGHGVSIGVEPVGDASYLWVETDSNVPTDAGRGTALLRFKFESGKTPSGTKFLQGSKTITAATDPAHDRLVVRRVEDGKLTFTLHTLARASKGDFSAPLARFPQPALAPDAVVFQGYTIYGQYLYTLDGTSQANAANINSYLTTIDMRTGKVVARALTKAGESLVFREPEGMAVYRTASGEARLLFGFASRDTQTSGGPYANLFFKNVLVD